MGNYFRLFLYIFFICLIFSQTTFSQKLNLEMDTSTLIYCVKNNSQKTILYFPIQYSEKVKLSQDSLYVIHYCYDNKENSYIETYDSSSANIMTIKLNPIYVLDLFMSSEKKYLITSYIPINPDIDLNQIKGEVGMGEQISRVTSAKYIFTFDSSGKLKDSINTGKNYYFFIPLNDKYSLICATQFELSPISVGLYNLFLFDNRFNLIHIHYTINRIKLGERLKGMYDVSADMLTLETEEDKIGPYILPKGKLKINFRNKTEEVR